MGERYLAAYTAKLRITVRAGEHLIVREGSGAGEAMSLRQAKPMRWPRKLPKPCHQAGADTFGNAFGLSLYKGVLEPEARAAGREQRITAPQSSNGLAAKGVTASSRRTGNVPCSRARRCRTPADQARSAWTRTLRVFSGAMAVPPALKPEVDGVPAELPVAAGTAGSADHRPQTDPHSLPVAAGGRDRQIRSDTG